MRTIFVAFFLVSEANALTYLPKLTLIEAQRIYTVDATNPLATAFVFDDTGTIVAVGQREKLHAQFPDAKTQSYGEHTITPGFIDAHGHLLGLGTALGHVDLVGSASKAEVLARLQERAKELTPGEWLLGRGWDQNDWPEQTYPTAADLDAAFADRPVWLERVDGHAGWANSAAMKMTRQSLDGDWQPSGGEIKRDTNHHAIGILIDNATALIDDVVPKQDDAAQRHALDRAFGYLSSLGITGVHDAGTSIQTYSLLEKMASDGGLPVRVYAMADGNNEALDVLCKIGGRLAHASGRLQMRALKLYIDGALGSRGAALLKPYSDDPKNTGLLIQPIKDYQALVDRGMRCSLQVNTHAIGDRGNRVVLDAYAKALEKFPSARTYRNRIEHAQVVNPRDIPRFHQLNLIASMQPTHATSDMPWAQQRLGLARMGGAYAWQTMIQQKVPLALGSDFPVESPNPLLGFYAAVTRADLAGLPKGGWRPAEKLTRVQALRGFTLDAAYAGFGEAQIGSIAVGKRADFVVLSDDLMMTSEVNIPHITVLKTFVDGVETFVID
jgi:predicted amidohydrolase YtcJ